MAFNVLSSQKYKNPASHILKRDFYKLYVSVVFLSASLYFIVSKCKRENTYLAVAMLLYCCGAVGECCAGG